VGFDTGTGLDTGMRLDTGKSPELPETTASVELVHTTRWQHLVDNAQQHSVGIAYRWASLTGGHQLPVVTHRNEADTGMSLDYRRGPA
jgi:hypothetical protein